MTAPGATARRVHCAMLPFWRLSAYYFFYFAFIGAFSPYFSLYLKSLAFSAWHIGVLMSLMQAMRLVAPNLWSWLADRLDAKMAIVRLSGAVSLLGFTAFFFADSFSAVFAAMALLTFFWSASLPLVEALTFAHLGSQAARYGSIRLWGSVGFIAAVIAVGVVLDHLPIASLLWVLLAILAAILVSALVLPDKKAGTWGGEGGCVADIVRRPEVRAVLAACFCMSAAHGALYVFYSIYLVGHGYGKTLIGMLWTLGVVAEIGVFLCMPQLLRRFSPRDILVFSFACAVLRFALIGWGVESLALLLLAQVLHGATFGAYHAAAIALINGWFAGRNQARGQALYGSLSFGGGGLLGGIVSGYTWDWLGGPLTYTLGSAFALVGLALVVFGWRRSSCPVPAP